MNKIKNELGEVAVLYSPGYGCGWSTMNIRVNCLFTPEIVNLVLNDNRDKITNEFCQKLYGVDYFCASGAVDLEICWLAEGTVFEINESDGYETVEILHYPGDVSTIGVA